MEHLERDKGANKLSHRVHCHTYPWICISCRYKIFWIFVPIHASFQFVRAGELCGKWRHDAINYHSLRLFGNHQFNQCRLIIISN